MTTMDPTLEFPLFYRNKAIRTMAGSSRWTVSGRLGDDAKSKGKAPIDMREFLDSGRVRGAWATDAQCLVALPEMTAGLPAAANCAFYLNARIDGLMVIDIEPSCPREISAGLLALPQEEILYSETSMSGRGYHLLTPLPSNYHDFPRAVGKRVLREEHGWYEILLEHWVTFTRQPIECGVMARAVANGGQGRPYDSVAALYESLAKTAKAPTALSTEVSTTTEVPEISGSRQIIKRTLAGVKGRTKSLDAFNGDHSRFEFSVLGTLHNEMVRHLVLTGFTTRTTYTPSDRTWLLFQAAQQILPARTKHNERRNGRAYLLDRAAAMVAAHPFRW